MTGAFRLVSVLAVACLLSSCVGKLAIKYKTEVGGEPEARARAAKIREDLSLALSEELAEEDALISMDDRGIVVTLLDKVLFPSGKADIKAGGKETLAKVSAVLEDIPNEISIEGHTDNEPIRRTRYLYKSNWELSTARATNVLHFMEEQGIPPERLSATGYGEYRPVAGNDTKEGRQRNRRVEIVILPEIVKEQADIDVVEETE